MGLSVKGAPELADVKDSVKSESAFHAVFHYVEGEGNIAICEEGPHAERKRYIDAGAYRRICRTSTGAGAGREHCPEVPKRSGRPAPVPLASLRDKAVRFQETVDKEAMMDVVLDMLR